MLQNKVENVFNCQINNKIFGTHFKASCAVNRKLRQKVHRRTTRAQKNSQQASLHKVLSVKDQPSKHLQHQFTFVQYTLLNFATQCNGCLEAEKRTHEPGVPLPHI